MKIKITKIKKFLKELPRILGEHTFLSLLLLILIVLLFGAGIFYKYGILIKRETPPMREKIIPFKEKTFQRILKEWQIRESRFEKADLKKYPELFEPPLEPR